MDPPAPTGHMLRRGAAVVRGEVALHPKPFAIAVAGSAVYALATIATSWAVGRAVDRVVVPRFEGGSVRTGVVVAALVVVGAVGLVRAAGIVMRRSMANVAQTRIDTTLRSKVVRKYEELPYSYHRTHPTGELLAHASADPESATWVLAPLPFSIGVVMMVVGAVVWLVNTDLYLAGVGVLILPGLVLLNGYYQRRMERPATVAQERIGSVSAVAHESFDGALVVKTLGAEEAEGVRFATVAESLRDAKIVVARQRATFEALLDALPSLGVVAVLVVGSWRVDSGAVSPGTLVSFVSLLTLLSWPLRMVGYVIEELPRAVAGWDRITAVLAEPVRPAVAGGRRLPSGPLDLEVAHLDFAYGSGEEAVAETGGPPVLVDISFSVPAGATVAVVGPTGSGKSTLVQVLARLLLPGSGTVALGGADLAGLVPGEQARACSIVFQEPFLFRASIEENVLLGLDASPGDLKSALELAGATEFIDDLPEGVASVVGERGATLSGGQRQRVALARALVRRPRLLLLDDATSAVDPTTEAAILTGLGRALADTTTLVVANRPSTLALADWVLYLEDGRLVGSGPVDQLLATVPGFERLVRAYETDRRS